MKSINSDTRRLTGKSLITQATERVRKIRTSLMRFEASNLVNQAFDMAEAFDGEPTQVETLARLALQILDSAPRHAAQMIYGPQVGDKGFLHCDKCGTEGTVQFMSERFSHEWMCQPCIRRSKIKAVL